MKDAFIFDILMALIAAVIAIILFHIKLCLNSGYREQLGYISLEETFPLNWKIEQREEKQITAVCKQL